MRSLIFTFTALFAVTATLSAAAYASPASYDDKAWAAFIEKTPGARTPAGFPTGKGAISQIRGNDLWPANFAVLTSPTDMSRVTAIQLSGHAIQDGRYFASESMTNFLMASSEKFRKLAKDPDIRIPVFMLSYRADEIPTPVIIDLRDVQLGLFAKTENGTLPVPDTATDGNTFFAPKTQLIEGQLYATYAAEATRDFNDLKALSRKDLSDELLSIFNSQENFFAFEFSSPILPYKTQAQVNDPLEEYFERSYTIEQKYAGTLRELRERFNQAETDVRPAVLSEIKQTVATIRRERDDAYSALRERILEQDSKVSKTYDTQIARLKTEYDADILHRNELFHKMRQLQIEKSNKLKEMRANALEKVQKRHHLPTAASQPSQPNDLDAIHTEIDLATTWLMFEAMLTQTAETISEIKLPGTLRDRLITHAVSAHRPYKTIEAFERISVPTKNNTITLRLACSIRDRFLGCPNPSSDSPKTEAKISKIAQKILDNAKSAPLQDKIRAIQLVVNANPEKFKNPFDIDALIEAQENIFDSALNPAVDSRTDNDITEAAQDDFYELMERYRSLVSLNAYQANESEKKSDKKKSDQGKSKGDSRISDGSGSLALPF